MQDSKAVDYRFKILYAVGLIFVVSGHVYSYGGVSVLNDWFHPFGFHIALFAFSSGYFYNSLSEKSYLKYIVKKFKRLILPLYIYNIVYGLFVQATRLKGFEIGGDLTVYNLLVAPITNGHQFAYNMGGWFVIPLFMVEIFNVTIRKLSKAIYNNISEWVFFILSIGLGIAGNQLACTGHRSEWWIVLVRMLYFLPFYALGIIYKTKLEKLDKKIPSSVYLIVLFAIKLVIIYAYGKMPRYTPSWCDDFVDGPVMPVVIGILGIALWMRIANIVNPVIGKSKLINVIADNAYSIMINHIIGFMTVKAVYGLISKFYAGFSDFDWAGFKTDIWWYYIPKNVGQMLILYTIAGLAFPILIQKGIDLTKKVFLSMGKRNAEKA